MGGVLRKSVLVAAAAAAGLPGAVQVAAGASEISLDAGGAPATRVKLLPIGTIEMRDGRGPYVIRDRAHAERIVAATQEWLGGADFSFDYDHQMLYAVREGVGGQAPASGWCAAANLVAADDGIYADQVQWTEVAAQRLQAREYRYLSPLFLADKKSGEVLRLKNAALVNIGAIDLPAIAAGLSEEEEQMSFKAIAAALGLDADADENAIVTTIATLKASTSLAPIAAAAGLAEDAKPEEIAAAVTSFKAGVVDLSNYVPKDMVDGIKSQLATLTDERLGKKVDELVAAGVVMPAKRAATLDWFKKDEVAATAFFSDLPPVVAAGAQLDGRKPGEKVTSLTADEVAACEMTGMSHEDFLAAKNAQLEEIA